MLFMMLLMLCIFTSNSLIGMRRNLPRENVYRIPQRRPILSAGKIVHPDESKPIDAKQLDYFKNMSALETRLNKFVNTAKDYDHAHNLIVLAIESDPYIDFKDKQELYDHYEEILYKKLGHSIKKKLAQ